MAIRDMLVHLDGGPAGAARLDLAAALARRHGAHLIGLFVAEMPLPVFAGADMGGGAALAELMDRLQADADAEAARVEATFREARR